MDSFITSTFAPDQRDSFGQYMILPNHIHSFEFTVPLLGSTTIGHTHILPNSQDFSLDTWISDDPLDGQHFSHVKLVRRLIEKTYYCPLLKTGPRDDRLFLQSNQVYYVNIKNLQNSQNAYELTFSASNT